MGTSRKIKRAAEAAKPKTSQAGAKAQGATPRNPDSKVILDQRSAKNPQRTQRLAGGLRASRNASASKGNAR